MKNFFTALVVILILVVLWLIFVQPTLNLFTGEIIGMGF